MKIFIVMTLALLSTSVFAECIMSMGKGDPVQLDYVTKNCKAVLNQGQCSFYDCGADKPANSGTIGWSDTRYAKVCLDHSNKVKTQENGKTVMKEVCPGQPVTIFEKEFNKAKKKSSKAMKLEGCTMSGDELEIVCSEGRVYKLDEKAISQTSRSMIKISDDLKDASKKTKSSASEQ